MPKSFLGYFYSTRGMQLVLLAIILLGLCFYPIVAAIPLILKVPSTPISISYRAFYLFLSIGVVAPLLVALYKKKLNLGVWLLMLFWTAYSMRMIYDLLIVDIEAYEADSYFLLYGIGGCFIPLIAVGFFGKHLDVKKILGGILFFSIVSNLILLAFTFSSGQSLSEIMFHRVTLVGSDNKGVVNPIIMSREGGVLFVMSVFFAFFNKNKLWPIIGLFVGLATLLLGASRGPLISALLAVAIIIVDYIYVSKKSYGFALSIFLSLGILVPLLYVGVSKVLQSKEFALARRVSEVGNVGKLKEETRFLQWQAAIKQIESSPIIGHSMVENLLHYSPHNLYLEIVLATGVLGGLIMLGVFLLAFRRWLKLLRNRAPARVLGYLLFLYLLYGLTGLALYTATQLWIYLVLVLVVSPNLISSSKSANQFEYATN